MHQQTVALTSKFHDELEILVLMRKGYDIVVVAGKSNAQLGKLCTSEAL